MLLSAGLDSTGTSSLRQVRDSLLMPNSRTSNHRHE